MKSETAEAINELLSKIINNNEKCNDCPFFHLTRDDIENEWKGVCFLAYGCVTDNFKYFNGGN